MNTVLLSSTSLRCKMLEALKERNYGKRALLFS
jgi:hypothetical protein